MGIVWYFDPRLVYCLWDYMERSSCFWKGTLFFIFFSYYSLCFRILFYFKVIWFTALFPYFIMSILLVRSVTLEGASIGLMKYITPDWNKLWDTETWIDSATQVRKVY
jgi:solute carrier family 6 GABA transporter-like protein 1